MPAIRARTTSACSRATWSIRSAATRIVSAQQSQRHATGARGGSSNATTAEVFGTWTPPQSAQRVGGSEAMELRPVQPSGCHVPYAWALFELVIGYGRAGRQVWNRQRRDEILVDAEDVAQGHLSRMRWNDPSDWVWSAEQMHEAIISSEDLV
jgi:hypothetical protein